jgi:DNA-binding transcriptional LysR family regulator
MRALQTGAAALRQDAGSHLRLGASLTVAEYMVPGWLRHLASALPDVSVSLEMGNSTHVAELVASGAVELGFIEAPAAPRRLRTCELREDELVVVVGPHHPWARRRRALEPSELAATPLILREQGSGTRDTLTLEMAAHGLEVRPLMELGSTTAIKGATASGGAPAVLAALAVEAEIRSGELVVVACNLRLRRTIRAVWSSERPPSFTARRLLAVAGAPTRVTRPRTPT